MAAEGLVPLIEIRHHARLSGNNDGLVSISDLPGGVMILGADARAVSQVGSLLGGLGLQLLDPGAESSGVDAPLLAAYNRQLLREVASDVLELTAIAPAEIARRLSAHRRDASTRFSEVLSARGGGRSAWAWADPTLSLLAPFWTDVLGVRPRCVCVYRPPFEGIAVACRDLLLGTEAGLQVWNRLTRAGLSYCDQAGGMVVSTGLMRAEPATTVERLAKFLTASGLAARDLALPDFVEFVEHPEGPAEPRTEVALDRGTQLLAAILDHLATSPDPMTSSDGRWISNFSANVYDRDYYEYYTSDAQVPYSKQEEIWSRFFGTVADHIVSDIAPRTVLDAGCARGLLVEELRKRGVDARGIDVSSWAIDTIPESLRPYCEQASIIEEISGSFDLIVCTEVLEHVAPSVAAGALENLCRHADAVLFSSTPDDFTESTHVNVQSPGYWAQLFAANGFYRDVDHDAGYVAPHAALFRRATYGMAELIDGYEGAIWLARKGEVEAVQKRKSATTALESVQREHDALQGRYAELSQRHGEAIEALRDERLRRRAEGVAHLDRMHAQESSQRQLLHRLDEAERRAAAASADLLTLRRTRTFRYSDRLRRLYGRLCGKNAVRREPTVEQSDAQSLDRSYATWIELYDTLDDTRRDHLRRQIDRLACPPHISLVMPVYNTVEEHFRSAIESVRKQLYPHWELCIADDGSSAPWIAPALAEWSRLDERIKVLYLPENGHISVASNAAFGMANGDWIALVDHDDVLAEHALAVAALAISSHPQAGMLYTDEDTLDEEGRRQPGYFKPDFDPLLLLGQNYLAHLCMIRRSLVEQVGGWRVGYEGSQDWDLVLRVSELLRTDQVVHVPHVLYHWRVHPGSTARRPDAKPYAAGAGQRAVADHLERCKRAGEVVPVPMTGWNRVRWALPTEPPMVSIVIPTRDSLLLPRCVDSVRRLTTYPNFEMIIVDNGSMGVEPLEYLRMLEGSVKVIRDEREFNYSALNNEAIRRCKGEVVCLLNDDTEVLASGWLDEMVGQLLQPGVGAVGAKLYYDDGRVQHAGILLGVHGLAAHAHRFHDRLSTGYFGRLVLPQQLSAVTAACMLVRRNAWEQIGGLDEEHLGVAFNDVDFCLRLREAGWSVVWTPYAELYHHESATRGDDQGEDRHVAEARYMKDRWADVLFSDPAYNPNLTIADEPFQLAWPPRVAY